MCNVYVYTHQSHDQKKKKYQNDDSSVEVGKKRKEEAEIKEKTSVANWNQKKCTQIASSALIETVELYNFLLFTLDLMTNQWKVEKIDINQKQQQHCTPNTEHK